MTARKFLGELALILLTRTVFSFSFQNSYYQVNPTTYVSRKIPQSNLVPLFGEKVPEYNALPSSNIFNRLQLPQHGFDKFSFCFYIKLKSLSSATQQQVPLLSYLAGDPPSPEIVFQFDFERQVSSLYVGKVSGVSFPHILQINQWTHICLTWEGSLGFVNVYVNTECVGTAYGIQTGYQIPNNGIWSVGHRHPDGGVIYLQVWDKVISREEAKKAKECSLPGNMVRSDYSSVEMEEDPCAGNMQRCQEYPKTSPLDRYRLPKASESYVIEGLFHADLPEQKQFSFCVWLYTENAISQSPVSIINHRGDRVFSFFTLVDGSLGLALDYEDYKETMIPHEKTNYYDWQHYCITWETATGRKEVYVNGQLGQVLHDFKPEYHLPAGSHLIVQQVQYESADYDNPTKGFSLKLTALNWWNYIITSEEVSQVYLCSGSLRGNIFSWDNDQLEYQNSWPSHECTVPAESKNNQLKMLSQLDHHIPEMKSVSVCAWIFLSEEGDFKWLSGTINFGICSEGIYLSTMCGIRWVVSITPTIESWSYICMSLDGEHNIGNGKLYFDGLLVKEENNLFTFLRTKEGDAFLHQTQHKSTKRFLSKVIGLCLGNERIKPSYAEDSYCRTTCGNIIDKNSIWLSPESHTNKCGEPVTTSFMDVRESLYFTNPFATNFYAILDHHIPTMKSMSLCEWVFLSSNIDDCADTNCWFNINVFANGTICHGVAWGEGIYLLSNDTALLTGEFVPQNIWTHLCIVMSGVGLAKIYLNGTEVNKTFNITTPLHIGPGRIELYQVQTKPFDEADPTNGFKQKVTDFNMWSTAISEDVVHEAYCGIAEGNIIGKCSNWEAITTDDPLCNTHPNTSFMDIIDPSFFSNNEPVEFTAKLTKSVKAMSMISVCAWVFVSEEGCFTWLSGVINFGVCNNNIFLSAGNVRWDTGVSLNIGITTYLCASLDGDDDIGTAELYVGGKRVAEGDELFESLKSTEGDLYLNQVQRQVFDEREPTKGFSSKVIDLCILNDYTVSSILVFQSYCYGTCDDPLDLPWGPPKRKSD